MPINLHRRLLAITFIESFATILVERGLYFLTSKRLGFSEAANLWLAMVFGLAYAVGALLSNRLTGPLRERGLLMAALIGAMLTHSLMGLAPTTAMMFAGGVAIAFMSGAKWPVIESFISAGLTPRQQAGAVGRFNIAWATAVPLSLLVTGPLTHHSVWALFALAVAMNIVSLAMVWPLPSQPVHLPNDHPDRLDPSQLRRLGRLLLASRYLMILSYATMQIIAALIPFIFESLNVDVRISAGLSGLLDAVRLIAFLVLGAWTAWHGRRTGLVISLIALPASFAVILAGHDLVSVLGAEIVFGLAAGTVYYAALYYAMVERNASVHASGAHEGLIGAGFAAGPGLMLLGRAIGPKVGGPTAGMALGVAPVVLLCCGGAAAALVQAGPVPSPLEAQPARSYSDKSTSDA